MRGWNIGALRKSRANGRIAAGVARRLPRMKRVLYVRPPGTGWEPITLMARLAGRLLEAQVDEVLQSDYGRREHYALHWPRLRKGDDLLVIAAHPGHLQEITRSWRWWVRGNSRVSAWVIDSFWDKRIPGIALDAGHFDQLFVTDAELVGHWQERTGTPTRFLALGTDALDRGNGGADRPVDLQRIGREPEEWADDEIVARESSARGISYGASPPFFDEEADSQRAVHSAMASAKFTLAFGNLSNPMPYTHPEREYITPRWLDALANGAQVAGIVPKCEAASRLLWPGATLELGGTGRAEGLEILRGALADWTPARAAENHKNALERLDWRWRIEELADLLGWRTNTLDLELMRLRAAMEERSRGS